MNKTTPSAQPWSGGPTWWRFGRCTVANIFETTDASAVWKREEGVWRMTQAMFNNMRPIGSRTRRFLVRLKNRADRKESES